jgi:hypothetical protein
MNRRFGGEDMSGITWRRPAVLLASLGLLVATAQSSVARAQGSGGGWSQHSASATGAAGEGKPVVIEVFVPLCSDKRGGPCGKHPGAGDAADLEHNIYWGAIYGARRFLDRGFLGWQRTEQSSGEGGSELERVTYKRTVPGARWGTSSPVDVFVVLHAIHGDSNGEALEDFRNKASSGGSVKFNDGSSMREESVHAVGFMGRNPLLKSGKPPSTKDLDLPEPSHGGGGIPSFSIAAHSRETLGAWLRESGSPALLLSRGAVASEGYLLEAVLRGLSENEPGYSIRKRATKTYARHHKMTKDLAELHFAQHLAEPKSYVR